MNCQHCQTLLLDHLYGLLDGPDAAAVDAHLAACPACAAARAETARVQGLIARAAKSAFPNPRFEPPAPQPAKAPGTPAPAARPAVLPFPAPGTGPNSRPARTWRIGTVLPWAVAAAVLLAIPGTVIPVLGIFDRARTAKHEAEVAQRAASEAVVVQAPKAPVPSPLSNAEFTLTTAEQAQSALMSAWFAEQNAAVQAASGRQLIVDVQKPATVQPGAPNDFLVVLRDTRDGWEGTDKRLVAEVHAVDATDAVIFS